MENVPAQKNESLPFVIMDKLDDQLIIKELEGQLPEILTYHYSDKGQEIWGLSKAGVDEARAELAKKGECLRELEMQFVDGMDEAVVDNIGHLETRGFKPVLQVPEVVLGLHAEGYMVEDKGAAYRTSLLFGRHGLDSRPLEESDKIIL